MLSTPHILVGSAIVTAIPNPIISLPLAFASHFLFDLIPHWDFTLSYKPKPLIAAFFDYAFGLLLVFWLSVGNENQVIIILGGIFATLPDFMMASSRVFNLKILDGPLLRPLNEFHKEIQNRVSFLWGAIFSIVTILISVYILIS